MIDNIQTLHIVHHQLQLKPRRILGDVIISTFDHRILTCHHGMISHQLNLNSSIISIQSYLTIENEQLYLFGKEDRSSMEIFQCDDRGHLVPYGNSHQTAECVLMDDFTQIGWKQILFLRDRTNFNAFILTDFSQIHVFQQEFDDHYHVCMNIPNEGKYSHQSRQKKNIGQWKSMMQILNKVFFSFRIFYERRSS